MSKRLQRKLERQQKKNKNLKQKREILVEKNRGVRIKQQIKVLKVANKLKIDLKSYDPTKHDRPNIFVWICRQIGLSLKGLREGLSVGVEGWRHPEYYGYRNDLQEVFDPQIDSDGLINYAKAL